MSEENRLDLGQVRLLRHYLAALGYRARGAIEDCGEGYADFRAGEGVRSPVEILAHSTYVLSFVRMALTGVGRCRHEPSGWEEEVGRFYGMLSEIDGALLGEPLLEENTLLILLQGPLSDAMTHVGQLSMLRRLSGSPVAGENFMKADIRAGCFWETQ